MVVKNIRGLSRQIRALSGFRGQRGISGPSATSMQMVTALCAVVIAGSAVTFTIHAWSESRNAQLVQIGISVLEIDPKDHSQVAAAREWALDLIEANSGGVKFSGEARTALLHKPLVVSFADIAGTFSVAGIASARRHADNPASNPLGPAIGKLGAGAKFLRAPSVQGKLPPASRKSSIGF